MLTVDFRRFAVGPGVRVLDVGSGSGRHSAEAAVRGARVVAVDLDAGALAEVRPRTVTAAAWLGLSGVPDPDPLQGDITALPFPDGAFPRVIASEVLEHVPDDEAAIREIARVLSPGGVVAVTVPRWLPERICWALSDSYHQVAGGHVRIYRAAELLARLRAAGLQPLGSHSAHALHSPYWWLRCALGDEARLPALYHRFLVWDLMRKPRATRLLERALDPLVGKSWVVYARKPA
jgi:SAM-dependent methyltransferase